jgi:hypothetical protein
MSEETEKEQFFLYEIDEEGIVKEVGPLSEVTNG